MKWDKPNGSVQHSADRRYCVVQANSTQWIAYAMHHTTADDLGFKPTDEEARQLCDDHLSALVTARQTA